MTVSAHILPGGGDVPAPAPKLRAVSYAERTLLVAAEPWVEEVAAVPPSRMAWSATFDEAIAALGGTLARATATSRTAAFADPAGALECAVRLQRALADGATRAPAISLHAGKVIQEEHAAFGRNVMIACGLAAYGRSGDILATREVRDLVPDEQRFVAAGTVVLDGVRGTLELFAIPWRDATDEPATEGA